MTAFGTAGPAAGCHSAQPDNERGEHDRDHRLEFTIPTTPGHGTGATISQQTARELIVALQARLGEIARGEA